METYIFEESLVALRGRFVVDLGSILGTFWHDFGIIFGVVFSLVFLSAVLERKGATTNPGERLLGSPGRHILICRVKPAPWPGVRSDPPLRGHIDNTP